RACGDDTPGDPGNGDFRFHFSGKQQRRTGGRWRYLVLVRCKRKHRKGDLSRNDAEGRPRITRMDANFGGEKDGAVYLCLPPFGAGNGRVFHSRYSRDSRATEWFWAKKSPT